MKRAFLTIAIIGVLVAAAFAFGGWGGGGKGMRGGMKGEMGGFDKIEKIADEIGLTDNQLDEIKKIQLTGEKKLIDLRAEVQKSQIDLRVLMEDMNAKSSDIEMAYKNLQSNKDALRLEQVRTMLQIRDVLSPNQRAKAKEVMQEKRQERREQMKEHRIQKGQNFQHRRGMMGRGGMGMVPGMGMPPMSEGDND